MSALQGPLDAGDEHACARCGFVLYRPVPAPGLSTSRVGMYEDARFPGRCIVVYRDHVEHLEALSEEELLAFKRDVVRVGSAVKRITGAARVNYAVLGNATPHLHAHVIPRTPGVEELATRSPWNDPRPLAELPPTDAARLTSQLARALQ